MMIDTGPLYCGSFPTAIFGEILPSTLNLALLISSSSTEFQLHFLFHCIYFIMVDVKIEMRENFKYIDDQGDGDVEYLCDNDDYLCDLPDEDSVLLVQFQGKEKACE